MTPAIDQQHFRRACGKFATGITILTVCDATGTPHGMTANSFTSVSLDPPLVLLCVDYRARVLDYLAVGAPIGVHMLGEHQQELSARFARAGQDRFDGVEWTASEAGAPILPGCLATLECEVAKLYEGGDHAIVLAEVRRASWEEGRPLIYFNSGYQALKVD